MGMLWIYRKSKNEETHRMYVIGKNEQSMIRSLY